MPIRAIMFDLDGTLIDQFEAIHRAFSRVLVSMNFAEPSFEEVKQAVGGASDTTMAKLIGAENAMEAVRRLRPIFEEEMLSGLHPLPGSTEILKYCKENHLPAAVLTNKHGPHARAACNYLNFSQLLSFTIGANDTEWKKPDPKLSLYALEKLGSTSEETLYVGDSPYDYETAKQAGMQSILLPTGTHTRQELSELKKANIAGDLTEIMETKLPAML